MNEAIHVHEKKQFLIFPYLIC